MKRVMQQTMVRKRKSPRKHPRQSLDPRQIFIVFEPALESADTYVFRKPKMRVKS
jgi:hypothetical protein